MRKLFWLLIASLAIVACEKADYTLISGKIENAKGVTEAMLRGSDDFSQKITLNEDGTFADTVRNTNGIYNFVIGREGFAIYLEQGDNIVFNADVKDIQNVEIVSGKAKANNDFYKEKQTNAKETMQKLGGPRGIYSLPEADFLKVMDSIKNAALEKLNAASGLTEPFKSLQKRDEEYSYLYSVKMYPEYYKYLTKKEDFTPSETLNKVIESVDFTNETDYYEVPIYRQIVLDEYINKYYDENADKEAVLEAVKVSPIKALPGDVAKRLLSYLSLGSENLEQDADHIKTLTDDKKVLDELETKLSGFKKLAKGQPSPTFNYESIAGKKVSLESLKGKLVYIDVWATWCGPCKGEIPFLQKLEKEYHGKAIQFVSVSIDRDKAAWEKMVKEQQLGGLQLYAENAWEAGFVKAYDINGIPRFILIDKEGNIISADAPRPSSNEIRPLINEWLKK